MDDEEVKKAVHSFLAKGRLMAAKRYEEAGQPFQDRNTALLQGAWVHLMKDFAVNYSGFKSRDMLDAIQAELQTRGALLPFDEVGHLVDALCAAAVKFLERLSPEQQDKISRDILDDRAR